MIARTECHALPLADLIDDALSKVEQQRLTEHLDRCDWCRQRLERLTADEPWWQETKHSLAACTELASVPLGQTKFDKMLQISQQVFDANSSRHWVGALLERSDHQNALGILDGIIVFDVIGQGGMGVVLRGKDERLNRWLAIKLLSPMLASNGTARQRFFREAQAAASIVHPNIVPIYAVSSDGKIPYIVMPLVGGGSLEQRLRKEGSMQIAQVLAFGLQVAEGLIAAHQQGIIHRDIKPANLLLDEGGFRVMLTDFGLARALDDATLTASGMVAGTPQYMSPEQAAGHDVDHRTDIYSLGAVLYALATGRPPYTGASTMEVLRKLGEQSPRPVAELNETYPRWFQRLLDSLMARHRDSRVATASAAADLLRACLAHVRAPQKNSLPAKLRSQRLGRRSLIATGIAACAFASVIAWQTTNARTSTTLQTSMQRTSDPIVTQTIKTSATSIGWEIDEVDQVLQRVEFQVQQLQAELKER